MNPSGTTAAATGALPVVDTLSRRWKGEPGRLEVWYVTFSDPVQQLGGWVHHEVVAPVNGEAHLHGWTALFPPDGAPVVERFGPAPVSADHPTRADTGTAPLPGTDDAMLDPPRIRGAAGRLAWDLHLGDDGSPPLFTFPSWAWERQVLPAAQVVPFPSVLVSGTVRICGDELTLSPSARGNLAHIYGHGNAGRWGWLHADLGGGDVLEIVTAVSRQPGLNHLPPLAFVQLRLAGRDWPRDPLVAAPLFRTELRLPEWSVRGTVGRWRLRVTVRIPPERAVSLGYTDPDGEHATCTNSELADADIVLEHRRRRWEEAQRWTLEGTAHAEVGLRP